MNKKILLFMALCFVALMGCSEKFDEKICSYCEGGIYWSQTAKGEFSSAYRQEFERHEGKYYHKWCYKIGKDNGAIK